MRTSHNSNRKAKKFDEFDHYTSAMYEDIPNSELEEDPSPHFANHAQFAPSRFHRQPFFKIWISAAEKEKLQRDLLDTILDGSPNAISSLLNKTKEFTNFKDELKDENSYKVFRTK